MAVSLISKQKDMTTVTIETSLFKSLMKKLVNEAIEKSGNARLEVKVKALEAAGIDRNADADDIEDAIAVYVYNMHEDMNYHDVIHQASFDGFSMLKDLWVSAGHSFINEQML